MILKGFFKNILLRVILITLTSLGLMYFVNQLNEEFYFTFVGLAILMLLQVYFLVVYINKINRNLSYLLESINDESFTSNFKNQKKDGVYNEVQQSLDNVRAVLQDSKVQHYKKDVYLENIVTHIDIGLFLVDENGQIDLLNPAAKNLLKIEKLKTIDELEKVFVGLPGLINKLSPSKPIDTKINIRNEILHLLFKVSIFKIDNKVVKLISLQNIKDELERNELNSWQKLIKVFTHEIMNSVTPIVSLAASLKKQFRNEFGENDEFVTFKKDVAIRTLDGLETVQDTSKGLLKFVAKYRDLTALPQPQMKEVNIAGFLNKIYLLLEEDIASQKIDFKISLSSGELIFNLDKELIELAIINLIKNSVTALKNVGDKKIELKAYTDYLDRNVIAVIDSGSGIKPEIMEDIFTPFFSTKEGGTGIGLSLCRQIMQIHSGKIIVESTLSETHFRLIF